MSRPVIALLLAGLSLPGVAQTLYRCGNTYSQTPCAGDVQEVRVYAASSPRSEPGLRGVALCTAQVPAAAQGKHAQPQGQRRTEVIRYAGQSVAAVRYDVVLVAERGELGASQRFACWLSEDQARALQFESLAP